MDFSKTTLVTHKNCMDGSTCAIVFKRAGGKRVLFTNPGHEEVGEAVDQALKVDGDILIADCSVSLEYAEKLNVLASHRVQLLDHHASAVPLQKFDWCEIEVNNCRAGGKMLYDYLLENLEDNFLISQVLLMKDLVLAADDYDRWIKDIPEAENLMVMHKFYGQKLFIERFMKGVDFPTREEQFVIEMEQKRITDYVEQKKEEATRTTMNIHGKDVRVAYVVSNNNQSILGNSLCYDLQDPVDVAIMIGPHGVSFRAKKNGPVDLSVLAKNNGGGGHKAAAGVSVGKVLGQDLAELVISNLNLEV